VSPLLARRLSDESLGSRLASGEAAAFDELYRRYAHRLAAYGAHLLGDGAAGDDVAQAAMLNAYGALRDGRVPERVKPWLYRIAHNVAIDLVVRRREWPTAELPEQGVTDAAPLAGALVEALASLSDRQRRVYVLRELHGLRIDETAVELSLTAAQVEQALFAARNRLAEQLVFGDRLTCVSVQRLTAGPLDGDERRALKSHLHSCAGCRNGLGMRGRALGALPVASLEWLRGLPAGAVGAGAPVAAKVGVAVATVTFAAGVPFAVETAQVHRRSSPPAKVRPLRHVPTHTVALLPSATPTAPRAGSVVTAVVRSPVVVHEDRPVRQRSGDSTSATSGDDHGGGGIDGGTQTTAKVERTSGKSGSDGGSGDSGSDSGGGGSDGGGEFAPSAVSGPGD
jgi:RNA polymerase sigma-70 factor (ECF subfamily)